MQTDLTISIENNHVSFEIDGKICVCRPLTQMETEIIKEAAKSDSMEISENDKGQAALLSFLSLELSGKIKYGMDAELAGFFLIKL